MASQIAMIETQSGSNRRLDVAFSKSRSKDDDERNILVTLCNVLQKQVWPLYRLFSVHVLFLVSNNVIDAWRASQISMFPQAKCRRHLDGGPLVPLLGLSQDTANFEQSKQKEIGVRATLPGKRVRLSKRRSWSPRLPGSTPRCSCRRCRWSSGSLAAISSGWQRTDDVLLFLSEDNAVGEVTCSINLNYCRVWTGLFTKKKRRYTTRLKYRECFVTLTSYGLARIFKIVYILWNYPSDFILAANPTP